jgi:hypothetical protein
MLRRSNSCGAIQFRRVKASAVSANEGSKLAEPLAVDSLMFSWRQPKHATASGAANGRGTAGSTYGFLALMMIS